jgi:thiol-disulfide isomerase/thioredoxin
VATEECCVFNFGCTGLAADGDAESRTAAKHTMKRLPGCMLLGLLLLVPQVGYPVELAGKGRLTSVSSAQLAEVLADKTGKVVLVNFWASWCTPCLKEIPTLVELAERYRDQGFELVPVSLDDPGDIEVIVVPFLNRWFPDFSSYTRLDLDMDTVVSVVDPAWNEILPTSYIINRDGTVVEQLQGGETIDVFAAAILPLLHD